MVLLPHRTDKIYDQRHNKIHTEENLTSRFKGNNFTVKNIPLKSHIFNALQNIMYLKY